MNLKIENRENRRFVRRKYIEESQIAIKSIPNSNSNKQNISPRNHEEYTKQRIDGISDIYHPKKVFLNLGIYVIDLNSVRNLKENEFNIQGINSHPKNGTNSNNFSNNFYFDVSIIICFNKDRNLSIDIILKNVTKYYYSFEKLQKKCILNCLTLSKLIHEFKTPINCIIGLSSELQNFPDKLSYSKFYDIFKDDIDSIQHLSNYIVFLIKDLMTFLSNSKPKEFKEKNCAKIAIDQGSVAINNEMNFTSKVPNFIINDLESKHKNSNISIQFQNYSLIEILNFSFAILTSLIKCSKMKMENIQPILTIAEEIKSIHISTDDIKLKQILLNLISNSVKFTNSGFIEIVAKFENDNKSLDKNLEIIVKDSGIGINKEEQHKIFQDYSNIKIDPDKNIDNKFGTGLGLSLSKNIAKNLGMDLKYDNKFKLGTKFLIIIPHNIYHQSLDRKVNRDYDKMNILKHNNPYIELRKNKEKPIIYRNKNECIKFQDLKNKRKFNFNMINGFQKKIDTSPFKIRKDDTDILISKVKNVHRNILNSNKTLFHVNNKSLNNELENSFDNNIFKKRANEINSLIYSQNLSVKLSEGKSIKENPVESMKNKTLISIADETNNEPKYNSKYQAESQLSNNNSISQSLTDLKSTIIISSNKLINLNIHPSFKSKVKDFYNLSLCYLNINHQILYF